MPTQQAAVLTDLASRGGSSSPMDGRGRAQRGTGTGMAEVMEMQEQFPVHANVNAPPNITPARTPADPAPAAGLPITPSDQRDVLILAVVRASSDTRPTPPPTAAPCKRKPATSPASNTSAALP